MFVCPAPGAYVGPQLHFFRTCYAHSDLAAVLTADTDESRASLAQRRPQVGSPRDPPAPRDRQRSARSYPARRRSTPRRCRVRKIEWRESRYHRKPRRLLNIPSTRNRFRGRGGAFRSVHRRDTLETELEMEKSRRRTTRWIRCREPSTGCACTGKRVGAGSRSV